MTSIRTYQGEIRLCRACGQPCYLDPEDALWMHFREQWDGIHCPNHPLAEDNPVAIDWDDNSLSDLKRSYPDMSSRAFPSRATT